MKTGLSSDAGGPEARASSAPNGSGAAAARAKRAFARLESARWALIDQCLVSATNFLTIYLFARHLTTADFGLFMLAYTGLLLLTSVQSGLIVQPHNVLAAGLDSAQYRCFTAALVAAQAALGGTVFLALVAAGTLLSYAASPALGATLFALAVAAVPWMGQEFVRRVLYTRGQSRGAAFNDLISYGLQLLGAWALTRPGPWRGSAQAALLILGASSLAGVALGVAQLRDHVRFDAGTSESLKRIWAQVWEFGRWLAGQNLLVWLGSQGHAWLVAIMLGTEQVGLYRAATHLVNVTNPLRQAAYSYLPSRGSLAYQRGGRVGLSRWVRRALVLLTVAFVPFALVLVGFPGPVLELAYGTRYASSEMALLLALSTVAQCITFSKFPFDIGLLALKGTKSIFYIHLIPVVLLATSGVAFVGLLGVLGVPLSSIVINTALLAATGLAYGRLMKRGFTAAPEAPSTPRAED